MGHQGTILAGVRRLGMVLEIPLESLNAEETSELVSANPEAV